MGLFLLKRGQKAFDYLIGDSCLLDYHDFRLAMVLSPILGLFFSSSSIFSCSLFFFFSSFSYCHTIFG